MKLILILLFIFNSTKGFSANSADDWVATKNNTSLFNENVEEKTATGHIMNKKGVLEEQKMINQKDSFDANSNSMYDCVDTSINGRKDSICSSDLKNPECVGLSTTLNNSTNCALLAPDGLTCLSYGTDGFNSEEWLSFSTQFYNGMLGCYSAHSENAAIVNVDTGENSFLNLTEWASSPEAPSIAIPAGSGLTKNSDITASSSSKKNINSANSNANQSFGWEYFAEKIEDGASYLGYEKGEIFKRAEGKESFFTVFTDSPFYQNKLNKKQQANSEEAINYPEDHIAIAKEKYIALKEKREESGQEIIVDNSTNPISEPTQINQSNANGAAVYRITEVKPQEKEAELPYYDKDNVASLANRSPASNNQQLTNHLITTQYSPTTTEGMSIFERVSLTYRKVSPLMKSLESQTSKDIQKLEQPSFFENL